VQQCEVRIHDSPRGARVADDERHHGGRSIGPPGLSGEHRREPCLDVQATEGLLQVADPDLISTTNTILNAK
jgi:hypothetical protein